MRRRVKQAAEQLARKWAWAFWQRQRRVRKWLQHMQTIAQIEQCLQCLCRQALSDKARPGSPGGDRVRVPLRTEL